MLHIVLFRPEIPQNTGNVGRLCAVTGARLHLIGPMGFAIDERQLRRSGMDYWRELDVVQHKSWEAFLGRRDSDGAPSRLWLFTTKATQTMWDVSFQPGDGLLFGNEGSGAPGWLHDWAGERRVKIPQPNQSLRSLNLSTAAGVAAYEALRQFQAA